MLTPPFLKPGDSVGIAAPGRKISREDVKAASDTLISWGLNVVLADNLFSNAHNYMAGSDLERIDDLQQLLDDKNIKAIICARGGYGTTRILDRLDFSALTKFPKWIVGFSDITAMHLRLLKQGVESVHGTMPVLFTRSDSAPSIESLFKILTGESFVISGKSNHHNRHGMATGQIIGGNLSIIVDAIGTPTDFDTNGKILIIEEVDEYTYRIDRMLIHLKRSGKLDNLAGLVVGHMTDINLW
jgi:muramoyltetrapeptide carboxypeptidase